IVGMFGRGSHDPIAVNTCVVLDPILDRARAAIAGWLAGSRGKGEAKLSLGDPRAAPRRAVMDLMWSGADLPAEVFARIDQATELAVGRFFSGDLKIPAKIGEPSPFIVGADDQPLRLSSPGGFSQASEAANKLLAHRVFELARSTKKETGGPLIELYSGA